MDSLEATAKTVEEALELALKQLGANREEVEVTVVSRGRAGILGIGAEPARVRVTRIPTSQSAATLALEIVNQLLATMKVSATATIRSSSEGPHGGPIIDISGEDSGLLIGRRGDTLQAVQFLLNVLLSHRLKEKVGALVDVEEYKARRANSLRELASRIAERVAATGRPMTLEPMPPAERRVIHLALSEHPQVTTQSVGEGENRRVSISPKRI